MLIKLVSHPIVKRMPIKYVKPQLPIERTAKTLIRPGGCWADAQADLSLRWAQRSFCWFCHEVAHIQKVHLYLR